MDRKTSNKLLSCMKLAVSQQRAPRQTNAEMLRFGLDLEQSTAMFGRLASPNGANNALSQVLYGLALRLVELYLLYSTAFWLAGAAHVLGTDVILTPETDTVGGAHRTRSWLSPICLMPRPTARM